MTAERERKPDGSESDSRAPGPDQQAGDHVDRDHVNHDSDQSFPASDPPSWSGGAAISPGHGDEPPAGPQARWSVEDTAARRRAEHDLSDRTDTSPAETPDADVDLPVPPEDSRQG